MVLTNRPRTQPTPIAASCSLAPSLFFCVLWIFLQVLYPIPLPADPPGQFFINASKAILTVNQLQLALMASWPPQMQQLLFDVEQVRARLPCCTRTHGARMSFTANARARDDEEEKEEEEEQEEEEDHGWCS